jgi:hypothetical protein
MSIPADINPGIRKTVEWLQSHGFKTCDSGDGETHDHECDLTIPYVHMVVDDQDTLTSEANRLVGLLKKEGIQIGHEDGTGFAKVVHAAYDAGNQVATLHLFNVKL